MASVSSSFQPHRTDTQSNKLYLSFWHEYSPVMYSLYEIDVPNPLPPPPTKDAQDEQIINPNHLAPILELKTGEYPGNMCCVSLGSKLYFMGGENDIDHPCIYEDVKIKYKKVKRDNFPRDVYIFDPTTPSLLLHGTAMNSGKSWPLAFVADEKIYVLGSNFTTDIFDLFRMKDSELKSLNWFEEYHPKTDKWNILPNPPIGKKETRWVGHAVERRKVFLKAWQRGKERLYCFDIHLRQWTKVITLPSNLRNVSGRIEFVEGTFYGCYHNTIAAIAPVAKEDEEEEEEDEEEEEEEVEEEKTEEEEGEELEAEEKEECKKLGGGDDLNIQQQQQEDAMCTRFKNFRRHVVSREMGMEGIFNVPQQLQSSSTLLHLGSRHFCYVVTGMLPYPKYGSDHAIEDDEVRVISIAIFQALGETYKKDAIRLFRAKFLHSALYAVKTSFPNEGVIHGCFSLGWESQQPQIEAVAGLQGCHTQAKGKFQTQYQAERSPFDKQESGSNSLAASGIDYLEGSAESCIGGEVRLHSTNESDSSTGLSSLSQGRRSNTNKPSIFTQIKYDFTLKEWLERNTDNWCPIYRKWNVDRPTEEAKELILCILREVYDSHSEGIFHGFLHHPENFLIKCNCKKIRLVYLAYENMEPTTSTEKDIRQNDMLAMSHVIFDQILGGGIQKKYPEDLEDLRRLLSDDMSFPDWTIIFDHPSLWHWKIRFNYIERVLMHFLHANSNIRLAMKLHLSNIPTYDWRNKIPSNTPLERIFNKSFYKSTAEDLLRYIRNVRYQYKEAIINPQTEADYLQEQFIEHKTTEVCEGFLVDLHRMVCKLGLEI